MRPSDPDVTNIGELQDDDTFMVDRPGTTGVMNSTKFKDIKKYHSHQVGVDEELIVTDNGNGTVTFAATHVWFYMDDTHDVVRKLLVGPTTVTPVEEEENCVCADRDTLSFVPMIDEGRMEYVRYVPMLIIFKRIGSNSLHTQPFTMRAHQEIEFIHNRFSMAEKYSIEAGFDDIVVEAGTLKLTTATGSIVFVVFDRMILPAITSATRQFKVQRNGTVTSATNPVVVNTMFDDGSGWQSLSGSYWVINWVFRGVEHQDHFYTLLSKQFATKEEAVAYRKIGVIPKLIKSHAIPIAKIVVREGVDVDPNDIEMVSETNW